MAPPDEKRRFRPLFRFTEHLEKVAGLLPDGGIVPVKTKRMAFVVVQDQPIMLGAIPHVLCEWVGGPLDGGKFAIPHNYAQNAEAWALITDPADV